LIPLVSMLRNGHTSLGFPQEERVRFLKNGGKIFPFDILIQQNRIFITANYSTDSSLLRTTEILSLNGITSEELLNALRPYISAELDIYRDARVQRAFRRLLWNVFGWEDFDMMLSLNGETFNKKIHGITDQQFQEAFKKNGGQLSVKSYSYYLLNEKTGVIDFRSMNDLDKFENFLDSAFSVVKKSKIQYLAIDIRNNGGGNSQLGDALINYITDKPYRQIDRMEVRNSAYAGETKKSGTISVVENEGLKKPKSPRNKFNGKTFLLTSNFTFSSANMLAIAFKCYGMGTIVGKETGGVLTAFGDLIEIKLPNTQLQAFCAHKKFNHPCADGEVHGVKPDVEIIPTMQDFQSGNDPVLEYIKKITSLGN
jgi:hypothetical protein